MLKRFACSTATLASRRVTFVPNRNVSDAVKEKILSANERLCKPLSVSEAKKLGAKGEIILEDELLLDRYMEELEFAEASGQVPKQISYDIILFFFAARGSISMANAVLVNAGLKNESSVTELTTEAYIDGLVQFGDFDRAYGIYKYSRDGGQELRSTAHGTILYGAIKAGRFEEAREIMSNCKDQFLPPEIAEKIVQ